jgi:putative flippase GtrA
MIGLISTAAYTALYLLLRGELSAVNANAIALVTTALGNTAANRRFTFGVSGRRSLLRDHAAGLLAFAVGLVLTSGAVALLGLAAPAAGHVAELAVLVTASVAATALRYVLLSRWIAPPERDDDPRLTLEGTPR